MIRQLSAIMFADMVGYTALMQTDERKAKAQRDRQRQVLEARVAEYEGKILQYYGDGALSIFQSAIQAVKCAISIQGDLTREPTVPLRIGIHVGDVVHDQEGVYGDGVNLASRIQDLSVAGGILISGKVADEVKNHPDIATEPLGEYRLKNVERPQAVFAITNSGIAVPTPREVRQWPEANAKRWARRRNLRIAGALVGISAIAGVSYWALSLRSRPGEDPLVGLPAAFERVAVLPFDVPGEEASPLGAKFQILLSSSLTSDVLRPVDRELVNSFLTGTPFSEETQLETGKTVAERTRANLFTTGTVLAVGDSLTVTANVWDLEPNRVASAESSGTSEMLFAVSDSLARQILIQLGRTDPAFLGDFPTESVEALNHFVDGDNAYKAADYPKAMEDLRKAIEIDDDFALAWFRLSQAATWAWHWNTNKESARKAAATDRLSSMNIETVIAWNDFLAGRPEVAEEKYWRLANRYPGLTEAWNGLGEVMVHYNLLRGEPTDAARSHFERVLEIEPSYGEARFHMLEFAARERDRRAFDSLLAGVNPESNQHLPWRAVRAYGFGSPADKAQIRAELERTSDAREVVLAISRVLTNLQDFPAAEELAYLMFNGNRDPAWENEIHGLLGALNFAQGKWEAAKAEFLLLKSDETERARGWAMEMEALLSTFPLLEVSEEDSSTSREELSQWDWRRAELSTAEGILRAHYEDHQGLRDYALGLLSLELEGRPGLQEHFGNLQEYGRDQEARRLGQAFWQSLRARELLQQGDIDGAILQFRNVGYFPPLEYVPASPFYSRAFDRWLLAEALRERGDRQDLQEALDWYETLSDGWGEFLLAAPAHLRQAEVHAQLGNRATALEHYQRFEELWKEAEYPLAQLVIDARAERERLETGG